MPPPLPFDPPLPPPPVLKKPMLSWAAIFPVLLLVYIQVYYGKPPQDHDFGKGDSYLVGFHAGTICGAVFASLLVTWIIYRLSGRSRQVSHVAFFVLMLIFCVSVGSDGLLKRRFGQGSSETPTNVDPVPISLDFRREPMPMFGGKVSISFPAIAKELTSPEPEREFALTILKPGTKLPNMNVG